MRPSELFDKLMQRHKFKSDTQVAGLLGLTPPRISQMRERKSNLSALQIASYIDKAHALGYEQALLAPIVPVVEMHPVDAVLSRQEAKWEPLPTGKAHPRNRAIREKLEHAAGLYILFDSLGCAIYAGKTERQNIWKEMTSAFNRERSNHQTFIVPHPTNGTAFSLDAEKRRQPKKRIAYLYNTASFFSAYEVIPELIPTLEALLVRVFCNTLSNKKMEKF